MSEPSLIDLTDDKEFMERVLKKSEEMQEETLKKALAVPLEKQKAERERTCVVCHRQFMQQMKINKHGKMVHMKGESGRFCSDECKHAFTRAYQRNLRAHNAEHFRQYNRKRMATQRYEQYKERAKPLYDELKSLILSKEDDTALELLTDISLGRLTLKEEE
jgi:hypothetical protein